MKILICTNFFEKRTNGTALFPNFMLKANEMYATHEIRVVTPDATQSYDKVIKVVFEYPPIVHAFYSLLCNFSYYKALKKIYKTYPFDIVVFNNTASGLWSKWFLPSHIKVLGLIHDDTSLNSSRFNHLAFRHQVIGYMIKWLEEVAIKNFDTILSVSKHIENVILKKFKNGGIPRCVLAI